MIRTLITLVLLSTLSLAAIARPVVIAHRGASGYLPEHTLPAVILAHGMRPDYIEQDLVLSKDGILVVLHDIHLDTVTNVADIFPQRKRTDGRFYAIDFTLAELKTLRVQERRDEKGLQVFANRYQEDGSNAELFRIATFEQQITLIRELNRSRGTNIGLYPELKSPAFHRAAGQDISKIFMAMLAKHNLNHAEANVIVQCFDFNETRRLRNELGLKTSLVQLLAENSWQESDNDYAYLRSPPGLKDIAKVADGIGPWLPQLVDFSSKQPTSLLLDAKALALKIHPYTLRADQLPPNMNWQQALTLVFDWLKVDGIFTDFPDKVVDYLQSKQK
ncbi:glycerophosphodiester phosphodiesterase [Bowmanella sp. Y26]|uniref:glycerophosphodiester phosphodiesterase n=1 Tax=Bowmanella yangjiangensis TaxID=2811230 RepID=UPI001BDD90AB|nr:glycerophosphodiester phosphodiesterase [Bowmanella yangjiangensis]MBT1065611.1 glycerophosphodiester phosphodiesterase [Bowmanella yangjiangensis]